MDSAKVQTRGGRGVFYVALALGVALLLWGIWDVYWGVRQEYVNQLMEGVTSTIVATMSIVAIRIMLFFHNLK